MANRAVKKTIENPQKCNEKKSKSIEIFLLFFKIANLVSKVEKEENKLFNWKSIIK